jgi:hypothetical protein
MTFYKSRVYVAQTTQLCAMERRLESNIMEAYQTNLLLPFSSLRFYSSPYTSGFYIQTREFLSPIQIGQVPP